MTEESTVEWEVPASDDEICEEEGDSIPTRVLLLFKQIERDRFIELETKECRLINSSHKTSDVENLDGLSDELKSFEDGRITDVRAGESAEVTIKLEKKDLTTSAFDYDEDLDSGLEHLPKRTPKSDRKTRKRVGVFEDVISDIKRYRELDAQGGADDKPENVARAINQDNDLSP